MSRSSQRQVGRHRFAGALGVVLLMAACSSSPTPYQAAQGGFGYSEQQIEENRYRVTFEGNSATSRQTVEDYLLYRAAELTVQSGRDYFQVVDRSTDQTFGDGGLAGPEVGVGYGSGSGLGVGLSLPIFGTGSSSRYSAQMDVLLFEGQKPQGAENAYDAWEVISRLQPKILTGGA